MAKGYMPGAPADAPLKPELGEYVPMGQVDLYRDGEVVLRDVDESALLAYIHKTHSFSLDHALAYEGYAVKPAQRVHPHILATGGRPDSVTHFICPTGVQQTGDPDHTHHLGSMGRCMHCHKEQGELRKELGL